MGTMRSVVTTEEKVERLKQDTEIQKALEQTTPPKPTPGVSVDRKHKFFLGTYLLLLILISGCYYLLRLGLLPVEVGDSSFRFLQRMLLGAIAIVITLAVAQASDFYFISRVEDSASEHNIRRILKLVTALVLVLIVVSVLFANWYTAVVSLGLVSLILGFALQTPITSFIGWVYILIRTPYRVGDRIKIGEATGDVIDVGYLDTTLWEFGGQYISGDHPSGRLIKFPNEKVLDEIVYNYSWPLFPYIWNEIKFQIAYQSDLKFVADTMQQIVEKELGEEMMKRVEVFRDLLARTPVDELEVRSDPRVIFRVDEVAWIDAIVRYLVSPREAGSVKTSLIPKLLAALNAEPHKVMFPAGANR